MSASHGAQGDVSVPRSMAPGKKGKRRRKNVRNVRNGPGDVEVRKVAAPLPAASQATLPRPARRVHRAPAPPAACRHHGSRTARSRHRRWPLLVMAVIQRERQPGAGSREGTCKVRFGRKDGRRIALGVTHRLSAYSRVATGGWWGGAGWCGWGVHAEAPKLPGGDTGRGQPCREIAGRRRS